MTTVLGSLTVVFIVAALVVVFAAAGRTPSAAAALVRLDSFCERRSLAICTCALISFLGSAAVATFVDWPVPVVHDEQSYLLAADTFASGRIANPTHPYWQHFETFYVFHQPTYASRFPPAQGLVLAIGQIVASSPVVGLWLSGALMAAAICWALYRFVDPRWAFLTGVAAACQIGIASYWTQSFWGGAVAATGGALLLGGAATLLVEGKARYAAAAAVGLVVLANSRPFEGAVVALGPVLVVLVAVMRGALRPRSLLPALIVLATGAIAIGAYNARVTGHWWELPYLHYESLYTERPLLAFQHDYRTHEFRHEEMRKFHAIVDPQSPREIAKAERRWFLSWWRLETSRELFLGRTLVLPFFIGIVVCLRDRRHRLVTVMLAAGVVAMALLRYYKPHYLAPATVALYAATAVGMQKLSSQRFGGPAGSPAGTAAGIPAGIPWGAALAAALVASVCASTVLKAGRGRRMDEITGLAAFADRRAAVVAELEQQPGKDLVIVRYGPEHNRHREWVYNRADIDASEIVWARDMGEQSNAELIHYFVDRRVWLLDYGFDDARDGLFAYDGGVKPPAG